MQNRINLILPVLINCSLLKTPLYYEFSYKGNKLFNHYAVMYRNAGNAGSPVSIEQFLFDRSQ